MILLQMLPLFAVLAYIDYQKREIPQWLLAVSWLIFGLSMMFLPGPNFGEALLALIFPIFGVGMFWTIQIAIEYAYKRSWLPKKHLRRFRFGLADVFILPLMLPLVAQFGAVIAGLWLVGTGLYAGGWYFYQPEGSHQKKQGIPILTFAFIALLSIIFAVIMLEPIPPLE